MTNSINTYEISGAFLKSRKNSKKYDENYDKIFRKKEEVKKPSKIKKKGRS
jgi:hypothetical protein